MSTAATAPAITGTAVCPNAAATASAYSGAANATVAAAAFAPAASATVAAAALAATAAAAAAAAAVAKAAPPRPAADLSSLVARDASSTGAPGVSSDSGAGSDEALCYLGCSSSEAVPFLAFFHIKNALPLCYH